MQSLKLARKELSRADHTLYVSLKYTRTVDVLKNLIEQLFNTIDGIIEELLDYAVEEKMIFERPDNLGTRGDLVKDLFKDDKINEMVDFSRFLKQLNRSEYKSAQEYRRHVTMIALTDNGPVNVDIDISKSYFDKIRDWLEHAEQIIYEDQDKI